MIQEIYGGLPPQVQMVGHWLLLLETAGDTMEFDPEVIGVKAETIQAYVYMINRYAARKYSVRGGVKREGGVCGCGRRKFRDDAPLLVILRATDIGRTVHPEQRKQALIKGVRQRAGRMPAWKIAEEIGVSESKVNLLAVENNISLNYYRTQWNEFRQSELLGLVSKGMSSAAIGEVYGISAGAVEMQLVKMRKRGVSIPARPRGGYRG